jgi:fucose 4-O-acetylase-like acetyltransferase
VDYAKGIGIILVVFGHVLRGIHDANIGLNETFFGFTDKLVYSFHMPLFLLLSGLFAERWTTKYSLRAGVLNKAKLLLIPYFVWSAIQGSINIVLSQYTNQKTTAATLIYGIFLNPSAQFWFVYFLFIMFVLFGAMIKILPSNVILLTFSALYLINNYVNFPYHLEMIFNNMLFFCLGSFVYRVISVNRVQQALSKSSTSIILFILFGIIGSLYSNYWSTVLLQISSAFLGIALVVSLAFYLGSKNRIPWMESLGRMSMPIYLMHILAGSGTRIIMLNVMHIDNILLHISLGVFVGLILPILIYRIIYKFPFTSILYGTKEARSIKTAEAMG